MPWNPNGASGHALLDSGDCVQVVGGIVYVTGEFTALGGEFRTNLVALNRDTASALPWNPAPNGRVRCLVASSNHLFVGGEFTVIGGQSRNGLAAFDLTTGNVTPWDPSGTNLNSIRLLALESNTVYVAGAFQKIGGELRANLAALDASTGGATAWNPSVTNQINALVVSGGTVYVGGGVDFPPDGSAYPYLGVFPPQGWSVLSQPFLTNGVLGFRVLGEEGSHYVVQASATLTNNWSPVSTNTVANGGFDYSEPAAHVLPRFYRAIRETSHR